MKLYGHALPLDDGGYVVTVICPNEGSKQRLLVEVDRIEADAFAPDIALRDGEPTATGGGMETHHVEPGPDLTPDKEALMEMQSDEPPFRSPDDPVGDGEQLPEAAP